MRQNINIISHQVQARSSNKLLSSNNWLLTQKVSKDLFSCSAIFLGDINMVLEVSSTNRTTHSKVKMTDDKGIQKERITPLFELNCTMYMLSRVKTSNFFQNKLLLFEES